MGAPIAGFHDDMSDAEAHVALATEVIRVFMAPEAEATRWDVRRFWRDNADERRRCQISKIQEGVLLSLCREACDPLPEGDKPPAWSDQKSKGKR